MNRPSRVSLTQNTEEDLLSPDEKHRICDFYSLPPIDKWTLNRRGLVNLTIELDNLYFLTIFTRKTREQLQSLGVIANEMDDSIPIIKPVEGKDGYSTNLENGHILVSKRLQGEHYVGIAHTEKHPIPLAFHRTLARFFWEFQEKLSAVSEERKKVLASSKIINIGSLPSEIPDIAKPLSKYQTEETEEFKYPDLIHADMERQNILSVNDRITGLVDLDSIRSGDILYEFGHFLFNFVLCDPNASMSMIELYIDELVKGGIIEQKDIPLLYRYIFQYSISDVIEFQELSVKKTQSQHGEIDLQLLVKQYNLALALAKEFFRVEFAL